MGRPIWSQQIATDVAAILGYSPKKGIPPSMLEADQLVADITEALRYLHLAADKIRLVLNFARFLRSDQAEVGVGLSPTARLLEDLRAVREFVSYLKDRFGNALPADESDDWSEEDMREFALASLMRAEKEAAWDEEEPDAQTG